MAEQVHIVFCADRRVLPGLHVAAYSALANCLDMGSQVYIHVFSDELTSEDMALLNRTLSGAGRPYVLETHNISPHHFAGFPPMAGSYGPYFRLFAPRMLPIERFVYIDVDTVCHLDASEFMTLDLGGHPAGFVAETTIRATPDRSVASRLPTDGDKPYFNSGVMVVNRKLWLEREITEKCLAFLQVGDADRWDQSALNYVLLNDWQPLDTRFNFISNWRQNWPSLRNESKAKGKLIHFLDNPKPWDFLGEFIHPQHRLWYAMLAKTALKPFRSWQTTPSRKFPNTRKAWAGYRKSLKDRLLFAGYTRGWLVNIKAVPSTGVV